MKNLRKILSLVLVMAILATTALAATSCSKKGYNIGILQLVTHDALDQATEGFKQAIIDRLGEENVTFDYQNAAGDPNTCPTIANNFVSKNVDLILANTTSALQACSSATTTIPILGTSVTEYGVALNIDNFNGVVGSNISGTSDLAPLNDQAQMIIDLFPDAKNIGLLYCSAEPNSKYQVKVVKEYLESKGLTVKEYAFADSNDVALFTENAAAESDVIYIPTDNTAASCTETINNICLPKKVPVFAGEAGICKGCGTFTLSISYYEIGYKTGEMAADILEGKEDISKMPIQYDSNPEKMYNKEICEALGITVPEGYKPLD